MKVFSPCRWSLLAGLLSWFATAPALAHKPSDSYLTLRATDSAVTGEWHLALRDLEDAVGLDTNDDAAITWAELRAAEPALRSYALARLHVTDAQDRGSLRITELLVDHHSDGAYAVLRLALDGVDHPSELIVRYQALFDLDPSHRGLLRVENPGLPQVGVFSPGTTERRFGLRTAPSRWSFPLLREGIWHIWTGYDHLLFLIALLLPGVLQRHGSSWAPQPRVGPVLAEILKTVTAFTLAHSLTLSLAALGWVRLPARFVECAIAASVLLAAIHNWKPLIDGKVWMAAFAFGLIHGFGFANALADLGLEGGAIVPALLCFNIGVETGQLAVVALLLPLALGLRHQGFYRRSLLPIGSAGIGLLASVWLAERALDVRWLPF